MVKRKKQTDSTKLAGSAIKEGALAEELKGIVTGRTDISKLIKAINIFKPKEKAKGGIIKKRYGGSIKKKKGKK